MKKVYIILALVVNMGLFSCTQPDLAEGVIETKACCGDDNKPPPPPPPNGNN